MSVNAFSIESMRKRLRRDQQIEFRKDFVFNRTLNLLIGAESAVRQRRIRPGFFR
ncbi:hypothetical protein LEP1GSC074_3398 [Leptospira noguchii str. Hook]|nr:hypothetical protein LEP1GSC074_3398 [Leptospira noguchii str. Hook]